MATTTTKLKQISAAEETDKPTVHVDWLMTSDEWNQMVRLLRTNVQISHYATRLWLEHKLEPITDDGATA
jgi:hypothetical protein